jgi:membrane protease YdiL (CAAX protease family)
LQGWLESATRLDSRRRPSAIVLSSLVFALMHVSHGPDVVPLFFFALALGYLYQQTHRVWPSLVVHICLNACTLAMLWASTPS